MVAPSGLEARLEASHKHLNRAAFWVVVMIVRRRFSRVYTDEALREARRAIAILETLYPEEDQSK